MANSQRFAHHRCGSVFYRFVNELMPIHRCPAHGHEHVAGLHSAAIEADLTDFDAEVADGIEDGDLCGRCDEVVHAS